MTDLWLHNRIQTLENVPSTSAQFGCVKSLFAEFSRYENIGRYASTANSAINGANQATLDTFGLSLVNSTTDAAHQFDAYYTLPTVQSCNATNVATDNMVFNKSYKLAGYSNNNVHDYPPIGVRMMAVENTTSSDITTNLYSYRSAYSSYSYASIFTVAPSTLVDGKYTAITSVVTGTISSANGPANVSITIPANTVVMVFLFTHWKYYTENSGYHGYQVNGFGNLSGFFSNTGLKPRNDFVDAAFEGGVADQGSHGPWNYWNKLVLNKITKPTGYSHLE